jgi:hypothetical protein
VNKKLVGSHLTRAMLDRGDEQIWCAVDDDSDERAISDQIDNDFTARIMSFQDGKFFCTGGMPWLFAVPIKISLITQEEVDLAEATSYIDMKPPNWGYQTINT